MFAAPDDTLKQITKEDISLAKQETEESAHYTLDEWKNDFLPKESAVLRPFKLLV